MTHAPIAVWVIVSDLKIVGRNGEQAVLVSCSTNESICLIVAGSADSQILW